MTRSRILFFAAFVAGAAAFLCGVVFNHTSLSENPFARTLSFEYPSFMSSDASGAHYVIDQSRRRVIACDPDGTVRAVIRGGSREDGNFFYANEVVSDEDGKIYVLNWVLDRAGFFMDREEILRYSRSGEFEAVLYSRKYEEKDRIPSLVQRGQLSALSISKDHLRWFQTDDKGVHSWIMTISSGSAESSLAADLPHADLLVSGAARADAETLVYATKKGMIVEQRKGAVPSILYSADAQQGLSVPWSVGVSGKGELFFSDLERGVVARIAAGSIADIMTAESLTKQNADIKSFSPCRLSVSPNGVVSTCSDVFVISADQDGKLLFSSSGQPLSFRLVSVRFLAWFFILGAAVCIFFAGRFFYINRLLKNSQRY